MDSQVRKRAFSKAFESTSHEFGDAYRQAVKSVAVSSLTYRPSTFSMPSTSFSSDKENETPVSQCKDTTLVAPGAPQGDYYDHQGPGQFAIPKHNDFPLRRHPLQDLLEQQHTGNETLGHVFPPFDEVSTSGSSEVCHFPTPILSSAYSQSLLGPPTPNLNLQCSPPRGEVLGDLLDSEPGPTIYEEPDTTMCGSRHVSGPLTPSELKFEELSLLEVSKSTSPTFPSQTVVQFNRTSVYVVQSAILYGCFPEILPNEVVVAFDKGKQLIKVDKYPLCNESRFFTEMLDGPFLDAYTRCIRLRDDFPYAIAAMLQFLETGIYTFSPNMRIQHPHITLLDLHIHAYLVGSKYDVPKLCDHAIAEYINIGQMILGLGVTSDDYNIQNFGNARADPSTIACSFSPSGSEGEAMLTRSIHRDPNDASPSAIMDRFLDSLVLLWKNTRNRDDAMRVAVLELVKPELNKLMRLRFFITMMMGLVGFGEDIVHSLEEDGFDVMAFPVPMGMRRKWAVKFGGL
ncbi:Nn.00g106940.m01.CDS01 [Neocucurbitaria sp. VM-36]